jgi:hypothetical protein
MAPFDRTGQIVFSRSWHPTKKQLSHKAPQRRASSSTATRMAAVSVAPSSSAPRAAATPSTSRRTRPGAEARPVRQGARWGEHGVGVGGLRGGGLAFEGVEGMSVLQMKRAES